MSGSLTIGVFDPRPAPDVFSFVYDPDKRWEGGGSRGGSDP